MTSSITQLQNLQDGKSKKIRGTTVRKDGDRYIIDETDYSLEEAAEMLKGSKRQKFPYDSVAFLLVKPPSRVVSSHQIRNRKEHNELLEKAKAKKYVVYYADVEQKDGKYYAKQPWIVDFDSVDNLYGPVEDLGKKPKPKQSKPSTVDDLREDTIEEPEGIFCPFCKKKMSSTPGRTLHVKSKHPEHYDEYMSNK